MSQAQGFLAGLLITAGIGFAAVWYLKSHLKAILIDLCGSEARADFWMAFSNITLILVPVAFAMQEQPAAAVKTPILFQLSDQLKWALTGQIVSVLALGAILSRFILATGSTKTAKAWKEGNHGQ